MIVKFYQEDALMIYLNMKTLDIIKKQNLENTHNMYSLKKKKFCKFTKAEHKFVLVIPRYLRSLYPKSSVEEFYYEYNSRIDGIGRQYECYHFECEHCGKQDMIIKKKKI